MAVYVTGDIHGDPTRLSKNSFYEQKDFSNNKDENVVIILGDFGLVWNRDKESKQEKYWLDWLKDSDDDDFPRGYVSFGILGGFRWFPYCRQHI